MPPPFPVAKEAPFPVAPAPVEAAEEPAAPVAPPAPKPVEVVALRPGVWKRCRKATGQKFTIPSVGDAGEWMKCSDPKMEKQHQANIAERKAKIKAAQLAAK